jgi:hypothetical protein
MERTKKAIPLALALLAGACSGGSDGASGESSAPPDDGGAWMDAATVVVARNEATGRETVTLVDPATGFSQVLDDEPLTPDVIEVDDPQPAATVAAALTR